MLCLVAQACDHYNLGGLGRRIESSVVTWARDRVQGQLQKFSETLSQKFKYMKKRTRGSSVVECLPSMLKALDLVQNDPHSAASSRLYFLSAWLAPFRGTLSVSSDGVFLKQHPEKNGVLILAYRKITTYIFHSPS